MVVLTREEEGVIKPQMLVYKFKFKLKKYIIFNKKIEKNFFIEV